MFHATVGPHCDIELRSAERNPLDFQYAMEKIRGKLALFSLSGIFPMSVTIPFFFQFSVHCEVSITFNLKRKKMKRRIMEAIRETKTTPKKQ